jgi:amphi-Trp domain-containing protein
MRNYEKPKEVSMMEIERSLSLTRKELADLLKKIADQLERGEAVRLEGLDAEVSPIEPILVKLEYEEEYGRKKIEIDIHLLQ